jgi:NAD(P)-dependent dehydrogenase (short-subunit alcohol dehydrogenase family)
LIPKRALRGIGLACTRFLLAKFSARVVAVSRTQTPALDELQGQHGENLTIIQGDVYDSSIAF